MIFALLVALAIEPIPQAFQLPILAAVALCLVGLTVKLCRN